MRRLSLAPGCGTLRGRSSSTGGPGDEAFEFSTGLRNPSWSFIIYRDGIPIYTTEKLGYYPKLGAFELAYKDRVELDIQLRGTAPKTSSGEVEIIKLEHVKNKNVVDDYRVTRKVVSAEQVGSSLSVQQQKLRDLKADIDKKAAEGVDVSAVQAKYDAASQALASAASASPSQAAEHIATATKSMDEAKVLLDRAWAESRAVQVAPVFDVKTSTVNPASGDLEPDQAVTAHYVVAYSMDTGGPGDEAFEFSTGLRNPSWSFIIYRDGIPIYTTEKPGNHPKLGAFELAYNDRVELDIQLRGTAPMTSSGEVEIIKLEHVKNKNVVDDYRVTRKVVSAEQVGSSLSVQQQDEALRDAEALRDEIREGFSLGSLLPIMGIVAMIAIVLSIGYLVRSKRRIRDGRIRAGGARAPGSSGNLNVGSKTPSSALNVSDRSSGVDGGRIEPEISITLSHTTIHADEWDKIGLTLVNTGSVPAFDITLTFSNDIETRLIQPVDLEAGGSRTIEAGIKPKVKGKVPLEITARYRDARGRTYKQTTSCWLSVAPRNDSSGSPIPSSIPHPVTPKSLPPEMTDRYIASEYLGKGGFARVFKVQKPDGTWAALKIPISPDAATGKSFIAELQNWTSMVHENIVRVQDYNIMPLPYFEMELCDGTLSDLERPVPPNYAAWLLFNICEGLKYAHARGILHRDLKPQNIMLRDGIPKISDWGLSKVVVQSRTTTISGGFTAYYAAPEQITNRPKDQRTDIWQLGVILYELVTGRLPFTGESMVEIGMAIATEAPGRPGATHPDAEPLDAIILRCLEKSPEQRYQSVTDLQRDLAAYLKANYAEFLKESIQGNDLHRSAYYCGDLVLISMKIGDLTAAYKYAVDLVRYSQGEIQAQAAELARQLRTRVEMGAQELPEELIRKAEVIVHQVRVR
jgi:hypothetical protein